MVQGIETDSKKYKHIRRDDEKWLCEDLNVIRRTTEKYIDRVRPAEENERHESVEKSKKKMMTIDRIMAILFLGIFGSMTLIAGVYLTIKENFFIGVPLGLIGAVFVVAFFLYGKHR